MTGKTSMPYGDPNAMMEQAAGLFGLVQGRRSNMNRLTGKLPSGTDDATQKIKGQSGPELPIVQTRDLGQGKGDEVKFHLLQPTNAYPIMGDNYAEGKGTGMEITSDKIRVNQARFPVDLGSVMSQIRTPYDLRKLGRPLAEKFMNDYIDHLQLVHLAGARGFQQNTEWALPTADDPLFAEMVVNRVKAPTKNRHMVASGAYVDMFGQTSGEVNLTTDDILTMDVIDSITSYMDQIVLPPPPVKFEGDESASDNPMRVLLVSPAQYNTFAKQEKFRSWQAAALSRAPTMSNGKKHPLFTVEAGFWSNTLVVKMPKPIRFYKGDTIKYCASYDSETESSCVVPDSFGNNFAVDRALLLGGQALAQAWASTGRGGMPFNWSEKELDHGNRFELLIGAVLGCSKIRFGVKDPMNGGVQFTDHGVVAIDTAVPIIGARM